MTPYERWTDTLTEARDELRSARTRAQVVDAMNKIAIAQRTLKSIVRNQCW